MGDRLLPLAKKKGVSVLGTRKPSYVHSEKNGSYAVKKKVGGELVTFATQLSHKNAQTLGEKLHEISVRLGNPDDPDILFQHLRPAGAKLGTELVDEKRSRSFVARHADGKFRVQKKFDGKTVAIANCLGEKDANRIGAKLRELDELHDGETTPILKRLQAFASKENIELAKGVGDLLLPFSKKTGAALRGIRKPSYVHHEKNGRYAVKKIISGELVSFATQLSHKDARVLGEKLREILVKHDNPEDPDVIFHHLGPTARKLKVKLVNAN